MKNNKIVTTACILIFLLSTGCGESRHTPNGLPDGAEVPTNELVGNQKTCEFIATQPTDTAGIVNMKNSDGSIDTLYIIDGVVYEKFNDEFFIYSNELVVMDQCTFKTDHHGNLPNTN